MEIILIQKTNFTRIWAHWYNEYLQNKSSNHIINGISYRITFIINIQNLNASLFCNTNLLIWNIALNLNIRFHMHQLIQCRVGSRTVYHNHVRSFSWSNCDRDSKSKVIELYLSRKIYPHWSVLFLTFNKLMHLEI